MSLSRQTKTRGIKKNPKPKRQPRIKENPKKKQRNQEPYISRTDQNSIKKTQEKLRQDFGMQIQKCDSDTMLIWLNDLPS